MEMNVVNGAYRVQQKLGIINKHKKTHKQEVSPVEIEEIEEIEGGGLSVKPPMGDAVLFLVVWSWTVEDYCDMLVNYADYTSLSIDDQVEFIKQVLVIKAQSPILMAMPSPMLEALIFKFFVTSMFMDNE